MNENIQTVDYYVLPTAERNRVVRNTYWLLAISMLPTVLGAWLGVTTGLGAVINTFNPDIIVVGGGVTAAGDALFVEVTGGAGCDLVASRARAESGRADVVHRVTELLDDLAPIGPRERADAAALAGKANIHGTHPIPAIAFGAELGLNEKDSLKPGYGHLKDVPRHHY